MANTPSTRPSQAWRLIDLIYETGLHPETWPNLVNAFLSEFAANRRVAAIDQQIGGPSETDYGITGHLAQALALNRYLGEPFGVAHSVEPLLSALAFPLLVVESSRRVLYIGASCSEFVHTRSEIRLEDGHLTIIDARVQACFDGIFVDGRTGKPGAQEIFLDQHDGMRVYLLPLALPDGTRLCLLAWFAAQQPARRHGTELAGVYSLTRAEADLLDGLLSDQSYTALAASRGVMENTVRSQVKQIFSKTDSHSRSELVQKVLCGPDLLRRMVSLHTADVTGSPPALLRRNQQLHHAAGRHIGFAEYGAPEGLPVLLVHDFSGSRLQLPVPESRLLEQGIRLIVPDRPGVGLSDEHADAGEDTGMWYWLECVEHLLDHLGLHKILLMGGSMGGVYALAAAAKLPTRFERLSLISTMAEMPDEREVGLMDEDLQKIIRLARLLPPQLARHVLQLILRGLFGNHFDLRIRRLPETDQALYRDAAFYEMSIGALQENLRHGGLTLVRDLLMLTRSWEFAVEEVRIPVQCWHGSNDTTSPLSSVERLVKRLPDCRLRIEPQETHLQIYRQWNPILAALVNPDSFVEEMPSAQTAYATSR
jgi:pimeloyl-ACP methyl ester carboxylesterase/DNA-binding CsgD family transcriptional regulator